MAHEQVIDAGQDNARPVTSFGKPVPRALIGGIGAILTLSLILTFASSLTGIKADLHQRAMIVADRQIQISRGQNEDVLISDYATGTALWRVSTGSDEMFAHKVLNGFLVRRDAMKVTVPAPYTIARADNGHIYIFDRETEHFVMLDAFGQDNKAVLARLLDEKGAIQ